MAKLYHIFFIAQKQQFNVAGSDYYAWVINSGGDDYYFMEPEDDRPEGYPIRNIVKVLASSGSNDMLYYVTNDSKTALACTNASEFAGGSDTTTASAWISFLSLSFLGEAAHSQFANGAAAKLVIPCRWKDGGSFVDGTLGDWILAGSPMSGFHTDVAISIFGAK